jgi:hypothetical protein
MPTLYGFGSNLLVSERSLDAMTSSELRGLTQRAGSSRSTAAATSSAESATPFSPIGLSKPLSIEIAFVYTGNLATTGLFGNKPDLLLSSAVKRLPVFDAAPRAVNLIMDDVKKGFRFSDIAANIPGTPLVYYSPALTDRGTAVTIELAFDKFPEDAVKQVGSMLGSSAGLPLFAPASAYLLAGGMLVKLFAQIGEKLVDGAPSFSETLSIDIDRPGLANSKPGFAILTSSSEIEELADAGKLEFVAKNGLRNTQTGRLYDGAGPYVVLSLDGTDRQDYASFAPTMASAALLDRFLHVGQQRPAGTDLVLQAMQAFNDIHFRSKAESIKRKLADAPKDSPEAKKLQELFGAYAGNISDETLKPKL